MSRSRNIKPGFFKNEVLAEMPAIFRLLFIGLWTHADREGRFEYRPRRIKAEILPYDDIDVEAGLSALQAAGFLVVYTYGGQQYVQIRNWDKHQSPHHKEVPSSIPPESMLDPSMDHAWTELDAGQRHAWAKQIGSCPTDSGFLIPDTGSLIPSPRAPERDAHEGRMDHALDGLSLLIPQPPERPGDESSEPESGAGPLSGGGVSPAAWEARRDALVRPEVVLAAALHRSGVARVNATHPSLVAAVNAGVTPEELADLANEFPDKPATYLLKAATSRRLAVQTSPAVSPPGAPRSGGRSSVGEANRAALDQYLREEGIGPDTASPALEHAPDEP